MRNKSLESISKTEPLKIDWDEAWASAVAESEAETVPEGWKTARQIADERGEGFFKWARWLDGHPEKYERRLFRIRVPLVGLRAVKHYRPIVRSTGRQ